MVGGSPPFPAGGPGGHVPAEITDRCGPAVFRRLGSRLQAAVSLALRGLQGPHGRCPAHPETVFPRPLSSDPGTVQPVLKHPCLLAVFKFTSTSFAPVSVILNSGCRLPSPGEFSQRRRGRAPRGQRASLCKPPQPCGCALDPGKP